VRCRVLENGDGPGFPSRRGNGKSVPIFELLDPYLGELAEAQRVLRSAARGDPVDIPALISELRNNPPSASRLNEIAAGYDEPALRRAATLFLDATARFMRALSENRARIQFRSGRQFDSAVGVVVIGTRGGCALARRCSDRRSRRNDTLRAGATARPP
jgi:hypothetical protein